MDDGSSSWLDVAAGLGVVVTSPFQAELNGKQVCFTALIVHFGGSSGIVVDPCWPILEPHVSALKGAGFGFSCIELEGAAQGDLIEILKDWTWTGPDNSKPSWL
jgi:hypothetical protein